MKKNIWILNHYASNMYKNKGGRHYWFSKSLLQKGYKPTIFCASTFHGYGNNMLFDNKYISMVVDDIPFVFVKTISYKTNGYRRFMNMISFYKNLLSVSKEYANIYGKPDVILASSVHPLTLVAGIKIAKKFGIACICEVRDLWPESIVAYGSLKKSNPIAKILYQGEKWIYKNANKIVMTWEGGGQYIKDQGWERDVDLSKVVHISNGVVLDSFDENAKHYEVKDCDLNNRDYFNVVYAGSIRKVNNLGLLLDVAKIIQLKGISNIRFLIYGAGNELDNLVYRCKEENINNLIFKGRVEKKYIPSILKRADINIIHNTSTILNKYGQSQNKLFEYLAAGIPIIQTYTTGYSLFDKYEIGVCVSSQTPENIAKAILELINNQEKRMKMGVNSRKVAKEFDFNKLTDRLIEVMENI